MNTRQDEPLGTIQLSWDMVMLPLSVAHKIQKLLATHAVELHDNYGDAPSIHRYKTPDVKVWVGAELYDTRDLPDKEANEWREVARASVKVGGDVLDPVTWYNLQRDSNG